MKPIKKHESMRGYFAWYLYDEMEKNEDIWVLVGDLGFGMMDALRDDFPERFINCGASEVSMMAMAVGLAMSGKIPIVYSITPFLIYRPFEVIRNYINHESIPVIMVGSGRDYDYKHDGISHYAHDVKGFMYQFENILNHYPDTREQMQYLVGDTIANNVPTFISLKR